MIDSFSCHLNSGKSNTALPFLFYICSMPGSEPITAGLNLGTELLSLIRDVLPADEEQAALFKEKHPKRYGRIMENIYQKCKGKLRWNKDLSIDTWVEYKYGTSLAPSIKAQLKELLHQDLKR